MIYLPPIRHTTRLLIVACLLALSFICFGRFEIGRAQAEDIVSESALAVSPAILEEVLTPGTPTPFTIQVHNITDFPLPIKSFGRNLTIQSEELEKTDRERLDASQWIKINEPDFILQPHQVREVSGTIQPPTDATPGGHYATIFFQPLVPKEALSQSSAFISARVGVLAFMVVKGDVEQKASIEGQIQAPGFVRHGPVDFTFRIHNSGNVHLTPDGELTIYKKSKPVAVLKIPVGVILPDATKEYTLSWDALSAFGKYQATLTLRYGTERVDLPPVTATFWVVPWLEITLVILTLLFISWFIVKTRKRWRTAWNILTHPDKKNSEHVHKKNTGKH